MFKCKKDRLKIEDKCVKKQYECTKTQQIEQCHIQKSRVSPSKCRNGGEKLNDLINAGEIANSNYERERVRLRLRITK